MITKETAHAFAKDWVQAWNSHDLTRILFHYTDDFEMTTPFIVSIMNEPSGTLRGKEKIGDYWSRALEKYPDLEFKLIDVLSGIDTVIIYYHSILHKKAAELFIFNSD